MILRRASRLSQDERLEKMRYHVEMRIAAVVLVLIGLGCGGDDEAEPGERLIGVWLLEVGEECATAYVFGADGDYDLRIACASDGPTLDVELYTGSWSADAAHVYLMPRGGSCAAEDARGASRVASIAYELQDGGETLRFVSRSGATFYTRVEDDGMPSSGGALLRFGCYTDMGFVPREVQRF